MHYIKIFQEKGCKISKEKPYRSVHYLVRSQPSKEVYIAEIQVRTLFEEGWSAIDHEVIYPINKNEMLQRYLSILNRLAGAADEMGSFVKFLKDELENKDKEVERQKSIVMQLKSELQALKKTQPEAAIRIEGTLDDLFDDQDGMVISPDLFIPIIKTWENFMNGQNMISVESKPDPNNPDVTTLNIQSEIKIDAGPKPDSQMKFDILPKADAQTKADAMLKNDMLSGKK